MDDPKTSSSILSTLWNKLLLPPREFRAPLNCLTESVCFHLRSKDHLRLFTSPSTLNRIILAVVVAVMMSHMGLKAHDL